jgi:hypothetical protein
MTGNPKQAIPNMVKTLIVRLFAGMFRPGSSEKPNLQRKLDL